jgi:tRNA G18 (ribose-2'-O)-methylase SpoU
VSTVPAPVEIESAGDPRIAEYVDLKQRPTGGTTGRVAIVESQPVIERLVGSRFAPRSFLLTASRYERLSATLAAFPSAVPYVVADTVMADIVGFDLHRGALAACDVPPAPSLDDLLDRARRIVVLEGSNDAENIGAVARSARALGIDLLLLDPTCASPFSRRAIRVSMGELLHLPVWQATEWPAPLDLLHGRDIATWALTPRHDATSLFDLQAPDRLALVAGAEGPGLSAATRSRCGHEVRIPMHHGVDSLNLGHALAVAMATVSPRPA